MAKKIKRTKLKAKYRFRRTVLVLLLVGLLGGGGWYFFVQEKQPEGETLTRSAGIDNQMAVANVADNSAQASDTPQQNATAPSTQLPAEETPLAEEPPAQETAPVLDATAWNLLLVNPTNLLPENFEVELETVTDGFQVDARIADSLRRMITQAKADGINLMICSAYRTPEYQEVLFQNKKSEYTALGWGDEEAAAATATIIARPRTSEHHTGLAVDIVTPSYQTLDEGFAETPAFKWLDQNAHKYGFIIRYPKDKENITQIIYEPWHYRYVGEEHAAAIKASGVCLEEYLYVSLREQNTQVDESQPDAEE